MPATCRGRSRLITGTRGNNGHSECREWGRSLHYLLSSRHPAWKQWMKRRPEQTESFSALVKMHHIGIKTNFSRNFLVSSMHFPHAKLQWLRWKWKCSHKDLWDGTKSLVLGGENGVAVGRAVRGFIENPQKASASRRALNVLLPECEDKSGRPVSIESASRLLYCTLVLYWATAKSSTEVPNAQLATVCNRRYHWYQVRSHLEHRYLQCWNHHISSSNLHMSLWVSILTK